MRARTTCRSRFHRCGRGRIGREDVLEIPGVRDAVTRSKDVEIRNTANGDVYTAYRTLTGRQIEMHLHAAG